MKWKDYHKERRALFFQERSVKSIVLFSDADKISLAEAGANCYHPKEEDGWDTRVWLERILAVLNHGCCTGCLASKLCSTLSVLGDRK